MNGSLPMGLMSAGGKGIGLNFDHVLAKLQVSMIHTVRWQLYRELILFSTG